MSARLPSAQCLSLLQHSVCNCAHPVFVESHASSPNALTRQEVVVGNMVGRILYIIREEYAGESEDTAEAEPLTHTLICRRIHFMFHFPHPPCKQSTSLFWRAHCIYTEVAIGNMVRRVLYIIREEYAGESEDTAEAEHPTQKSLQLLVTRSLDKINDYREVKHNLKSSVIEAITELRLELENRYFSLFISSSLLPSLPPTPPQNVFVNFFYYAR